MKLLHFIDIMIFIITQGVNTLNKTLFDDMVTDEYGTWTQVCKNCAEKHNFTGRLCDIPGVCICGVVDCENDADYYLDFN